jgi:hypothetical protein
LRNPNSLISKSLEQFRPTPTELLRAHILKNMQGAAGANMEIPGAPAPAPNQITRMVGDVPVPRALNGIAALQFNKAKGLWRDQTTGKVYDTKGAEVVQ